jgi:hypothetical protein
MLKGDTLWLGLYYLVELVLYQPYIVEEIILRGHKVAIFNRGKTETDIKVKSYIGDRNIKSELKAKKSPYHQEF